jgi:hypothetical protein
MQIICRYRFRDGNSHGTQDFSLLYHCHRSAHLLDASTQPKKSQVTGQMFITEMFIQSLLLKEPTAFHLRSSKPKLVA